MNWAKRFLNSRESRFVGMLAITAVSLISFYNNCSQSSNTLSNNSASGFPVNSLTWRPNHIASFSCASDGFPQGTSSTYAYPSFWLWYSQKDVPGFADPYPAGLALSLDAQDFVGKNKLSSGAISSFIPDMQPTFELVNGYNDSTPSASGWYPSSADASQLDIDRSLHTTAQTASALSNLQAVPINDMRLTTANFPPAAGATSFSLGLLFHTSAGTSNFDNLTYPLVVGGQTQSHVAGEVLQYNIWGRAVEATTNGGFVLPYNAQGLDRVQLSSPAGRTHDWICQRFFVSVPDGIGQSAQCVSDNSTSASALGLGDLSKIAAIGRFGRFNGLNCFVPSASYYAQTNNTSCYSGAISPSSQNPYDPIAQVNNAPNNQKPAWFTSSTPWRYADQQSPHWLSLCFRQAQ